MITVAFGGFVVDTALFGLVPDLDLPVLFGNYEL